MTDFYGMKRLFRPEDWKSISGEKNWVPGRSAYELAHAWQGSAGFPKSVQAVLANSSNSLLKDLVPELGVVEFPVFLDTRKAPSMTDTMLYCRTSSGSGVVVAIEGKATESFGPQLAAWLRGDGQGVPIDGLVRPTRSKRLAFLNEILRVAVDEGSLLRYQLLDRTASAILEAAKTNASAAVLLVHSFADCEENWLDYSDYLGALGLDASKNIIQGPLTLGAIAKGIGVQTYFAWVSDSPYSAQPN